jgi:CRP/FNR family transcriptional regulator, nitrogen fixation regulation protein
MRVRRKFPSGNAAVGKQVPLNFPALSPQFDERFSLPSWAELLTAVPVTYARNVEIFGEQEPVQYLYKVMEGAVRTFTILSDGRRQIAAFYLSGEFFGLETANEHTLSAEAITNSKILVIKSSVLEVLAQHDAEVSRHLLNLTGNELKRTQAHVTLLIKSASERVAGFLLEMASRAQATAIDLPMTRQDIADYLGLTIETVSRVLSDFEAVDVIIRPTVRRVVLRDRAALFRLHGEKIARHNANALR